VTDPPFRESAARRDARYRETSRTLARFRDTAPRLDRRPLNATHCGIRRHAARLRLSFASRGRCNLIDRPSPPRGCPTNGPERSTSSLVKERPARGAAPAPSRGPYLLPNIRGRVKRIPNAASQPPARPILRPMFFSPALPPSERPDRGMAIPGLAALDLARRANVHWTPSLTLGSVLLKQRRRQPAVAAARALRMQAGGSRRTVTSVWVPR
jgi:hypothetical protein